MNPPDWRDGLRERLRERLLELCAIPSPSLRERRIADHLTALLQDRGLTVREDGAGRTLGGDCGNLIAELPGERQERIVLNAHIDTVPLVPGEPLAPVADGDRIHSGGRQILGADDKAGVAVVLELVRGLQAVPASQRPTVLAVFTVAEERGLRGAGELDVAALKADFGYAFDGEVPVGQVIARAPFKEDLTLTVRGRRAHAALEPDKGIHALLAAARVIEAFPLGRIGPEAVANLGTVSGGSASNVVPDEVVLRGETRAFDEATLEQLNRDIAERARAAAATLGAEIRLERRRLYAGYDVPFDARPFLRLAGSAPRHGVALEKVASIGGSDTNILNGKGLATVNLGVGMHEIHSVDEWISVADLARVAGWLLDCLTGGSE